jgi:F-type H+-transporting ATPase subunit epsilon
MADVHFEIVTPEKLVRSDDAFMVVVPGTEGDFGVLAGHAPLMSVIRDGEIAIYSNATTVTSRIRVQGGFAEVNDKGLTILAEHVEERG